MRRPEWYLSIQPRRDVLEFMLTGDPNPELLTYLALRSLFDGRYGVL